MLKSTGRTETYSGPLKEKGERSDMSRLPAGATLGKVILVGAGPGDPDLITVAGLRALRTCDAVAYDRLIAPELLAEAPRRARRIFVGKTPGGPQRSQADINRMLISLAARGKTVVRLKGGDPFVFGRGAEEALALREAGIPFEIVPGVSSALAAPAYAGIPVTHRGLSSSFAVVTGRSSTGRERDWGALAGVDTLVLMMGMASLRETSERLIDAGRSPSEPAAIVEWGTTDDQRVVTATLATISDAAEGSGMRPPATAIIGSVVELGAALRWFEPPVELRRAEAAR